MDNIRTENYIGLNSEEAKRRAHLEGLACRITSVDGVPRVVTRDFNPDRLNFYIENNIVEDVTLG